MEPPSSSDQLQTPRGVHDVLPEQRGYMALIENAMRHQLLQSGFRQIETPVFEESALFQRAIGAQTDLVQHELYTFADPEGTSVTLRPEFTSSIMRAYLQHNMQAEPQPVLLYAVGPVFRFVAPQRGRYRQFHQFGFEAIGESDPALDAQIIHLAWRIHRDLGIDDRFTLQVNSLGTAENRKAFLADFTHYFEGKERSMSADDRKLLEENPLRILDSKDEDTQILVAMAPKLITYLDDASRVYHEELLASLDTLDVPYVENHGLVRGIEYYSRTVFEFWDATHGADQSVGGGGRFDTLAETLGGPAIPAVGYAGNIERLVNHLKSAGVEPKSADQVDVFVAQLGPEAKRVALKLLSNLRDENIRSVGALGKGSMKEQLHFAESFHVPYALILGQVEVRERTVIVRDMRVGKQWTVPLGKAIEEVRALLRPETVAKAPRKSAAKKARG